MVQAIREAFVVNAKDEKELLDILLKLNNTTRSKFATYMEIEEYILNDNPKWAINHLSDLLNAHLIHLGYFIKDTKTDGIIKPIARLEKEINELKVSDSIDAQIPFILNQDIVTEQGEVKVSYIANIERLLEDFKTTLNE